MKYSYLFGMLFGLCSLLQAQTVMQPSWVKVKHATNDINAEGWGLATDGVGNVYWPISTDSLQEGLDIFCYKYDSEGNPLWAAPFLFGGPGTQHAYVSNFHDGNLYIGGRGCTGLPNTCDMLLLKVDAENGSLLWDRTQNFAGNGYDELDGLAFKSDGIYGGGWAHDNEPGIFFADVGLWKLDYDGNTEWTNAFGETGTAEHQDGHFVVDEQYIYTAGLWEGSGLLNLYNGHAFLGKFDRQDGSLVDSTLFGPQSDNALDIENALGMTTDGEFLYITGYSTPVSADNWQLFVAKFDKELNQIWWRDWGAEGTETARGIRVINDVIYIAGLTESPSLSAGGIDGLLLQYTVEGDFISYQTWGDEQDNTFRDIVIDQSNIYLAGTNTSQTDSHSAFLLKLEGQVTSVIDNRNEEAPLFTLAPNPSRGQLHLQLVEQIQQASLILVHDSQGQLITRRFVQAGQTSDTIPLAQAGIYMITLIQGQKRHTIKAVNLP